VLYADSGAPNPYLRLLYHRLPDAGLWPTPRRQPLDGDVSAPDVVHVHWLPDLEIADDEADARGRVESFLGRLDAALERGARLVRTVHELHGHDERFPELTRRTHAALYERAHTVHLLHESTRDELHAAYDVEADRTFVVAHPLYTGWYPDLLPRMEARRHLGVADDDILLLGFGAIRPYKGFDRLLEIAGRLDRRVRVLVAGPAPIGADLSALGARRSATRVGSDSRRPGCPTTSSTCCSAPPTCACSPTGPAR
jgi:beta-1,4-mannosyltransferase